MEKAKDDSSKRASGPSRCFLPQNAGGGCVESISTKMGNSIDQSKTLQKVYIPDNRAAVRAADEARKKGRRRLLGLGRKEAKNLKPGSGESLKPGREKA
ncbi:hypothetical protein [Aquibium sp. ELW1220]|uniref:hypothetical protein n=1 Tax=Aquibium sp. ELW1220 TaxID=2976766 RepID=UPI0025B10D7D|nr:hypothetical protein [Aquibium sp. ELW1220]MDN2581183.1 hypothetical protein [Aquibium sp. ELW1220]